MRAGLIAGGVVSALLLTSGPLGAQSLGPFIRVPTRAGDVYVPLDAAGRPTLVPGVPAAPASPAEPGAPTAPAAPVAPSETPKGGGYHVIPSSADRSDDPATGSGFYVVPKP